MTTTILCEKHSQAQAIGHAMKFNGTSGQWRRERFMITWASGHLLEMETPDSATPKANWYDPASLLPLPQTVRMMPKTDAGKRLKSIQAALAQASMVWIATDPDREGEAIGRELLAHFGYRGPRKRLWLAGGMDDASILQALDRLRDGDASLGLWRAQQARSRADYGFMYLTRAATAVARAGGLGESLGTGTGRASVASVGRVQAPTLRLIYDREKAIANFKPVTHYRPELAVSQGDAVATLAYSPVVTEDMTARSWPGVEWQPREKGLDKPLFVDATRVAAFRIELAALDQATITVKRARKKKPAPLCLALIDLQRAMSRSQKMPSGKTLEVAQMLYTCGYISYPRTEHRELPVSAWADAPDILRALSGMTEPALDAHAHQVHVNTKRPRAYSNKPMEHHGLMPTRKVPGVPQLSSAEQAVYMAVVRSYVEAHLPDAVVEQTLTATMVRATGLFDEAPSRFERRSERVVDPGWMAAYRKTGVEQNQVIHLTDGAAVIDEVQLTTAKTQAPKPYTEDTLLAAMKNAARFVEGDDVAIMRRANGLGTPATRGTIIDTLTQREYIQRDKRAGALRIKEKGVDLIEYLPDELTDVAITARWENDLSEIEIAADQRACPMRDQFIRTQDRHITAMIESIATAMPAREHRRSSERPQRDGKPTAKMLELARKVAKQNGKRLTKRQIESFDGCRSWLDASCGRSSGPSDRMLEYAERLARQNQIQLPGAARTDYRACKAFLDANA